MGNMRQDSFEQGDERQGFSVGDPKIANKGPLPNLTDMQKLAPGIKSSGPPGINRGFSQEEFVPSPLQPTTTAATTKSPSNLPSQQQNPAASQDPRPTPAFNFVRPSDIYKRMEEERQKEKLAMDNKRSQTDSTPDSIVQQSTLKSPPNLMTEDLGPKHEKEGLSPMSELGTLIDRTFDDGFTTGSSKSADTRGDYASASRVQEHIKSPLAINTTQPAFLNERSPISTIREESPVKSNSPHRVVSSPQPLYNPAQHRKNIGTNSPLFQQAETDKVKDIPLVQKHNSISSSDHSATSSRPESATKEPISNDNNKVLVNLDDPSTIPPRSPIFNTNSHDRLNSPLLGSAPGISPINGRESPLSGKVKNLAGKYNDIHDQSKRNSQILAGSRSDESGSVRRPRTREGSSRSASISDENYASPQISPTLVHAPQRPVAIPQPSFRPQLPGGWISNMDIYSEPESIATDEGRRTSPTKSESIQESIPKIPDVVEKDISQNEKVGPKHDDAIVPVAVESIKAKEPLEQAQVANLTRQSSSDNVVAPSKDEKHLSRPVSPDTDKSSHQKTVQRQDQHDRAEESDDSWEHDGSPIQALPAILPDLKPASTLSSPNTAITVNPNHNAANEGPGRLEHRFSWEGTPKLMQGSENPSQTFKTGVVANDISASQEQGRDVHADNKKIQLIAKTENKISGPVSPIFKAPTDIVTDNAEAHSPVSDLSKSSPVEKSMPIDPQSSYLKYGSSGQEASAIPTIDPKPSVPVSQTRLTPFKEILAIKTTDERIRAYQATRNQFTHLETGLQNWLQHMITVHPDYKDLTTPSPSTGFIQGNPPPGSVRHRQTPSLVKMAKGLATATRDGTSSPPPEVVSNHRVPSGTHSLTHSPQASATVAKVSKDLKLIGNKLGGSAKSLLAKGKQKLKESGVGGSNDKVD